MPEPTDLQKVAQWIKSDKGCAPAGVYNAACRLLDKPAPERTPPDDTTEGLRERLRETARAAFASRKLPDGSYAIYSDRNPWRALDDAVDAVLAAPYVEAIHRAVVRIHRATLAPEADHA